MFKGRYNDISKMLFKVSKVNILGTVQQQNVCYILHLFVLLVMHRCSLGDNLTILHTFYHLNLV